MTNFLDTLRNLKGEASVSQQQELTRIASARGGKATTGVGPQASNIREQTAIQGVKEQQRQQQIQGGMMAASLGQQQQQQQQQLQTQQKTQQQGFAEALTGLAQQKQLDQEQQTFRQMQGEKAMDAQYKLQTNQIAAKTQQTLQQLSQHYELDANNLFRNFDHSSAALEDRRDAAALEQQSFVYALSDQKYLKQLEAVGRQRQLVDQLNFQKESLDIALGKDLSSVVSDIGFREALSADQATFARKLANIDISQALEVARAAVKSQATTNIIEGATKASAAYISSEG